MAKYSEEIVKEIVKFLKSGASQKDAANLAGIAESTYYEWKKISEFSEAIKKAENECKMRNIAIIQKAAEKTWQAAAWWLERKHYDEFAIKTIQEHRGKDGGEILIKLDYGGNIIHKAESVPAETN